MAHAHRWSMSGRRLVYKDVGVSPDAGQGAYDDFQSEVIDHSFQDEECLFSNQDLRHAELLAGRLFEARWGRRPTPRVFSRSAS